MEKRGPTPGSGSYGKACMQCVKAKCRCVGRPDSAGCERCLRLNKQCQPSDSIRRRTRRSLESGEHIAKLEGRIDTLTTMLQSIANATRVQRNPNDSLISTDASTSGEISNSDNEVVPPSLTDAPSQSSSSRTSDLANTSSPLYELTLDEAAWYLDRFMNHMLPCFPFICISPGTTAQQLRRDRPFLTDAIIAVATPSTQEKMARADRLKYHLTRSAVLENQSSIDMLLGILTYIAWSTDPFFQRASNLSRMIMLAMSLVYDLQLGKSPQPPDSRVIAMMTPGLGKPEQQSGDGSAHGILEQQSAVLACFVLSSIISSFFGRIVPLRWNSHMEEAVGVIEMNKACPSDGSFAIQVRLQVIAQRALYIREQQEADHANATGTAPTTPFETSMYLKMLQGQLQELRDSFSPHLQRRGVADMLTAYAHYVELCINEMTRLASSEDPLLPTTGSSDGSSSSTTGFEHLECLWRSLYAVKSWLDVFYTIPPATYVGFPFFFWFQLVRCIVILKHLSTFDDPAWDCEAVRNTVDMLTLLEWMAEKAELASREAGERSDDDLFRRVSKMLRLSQRWVIAKQRAAAEVSTSLYSDRPALAPAEDDMMDFTEMAWMNALESGDGTWLEEFLGWSPTAL